MKNLLFVLTLTTLLVGCSSNGYDNSSPNKDTTKEPPPATQPAKTTEPVTSENTKVSQQDQVTPIDQGENEADLTVTQNIRQALIDDDSLSLAAKNVTIVTANNEITLRGEVNTASEKQKIGAAAQKNSGNKKVTNLLTVATK